MGSGGTGREPESLREDGRAVGSVSSTGPTGLTGTVDQVDLARDWLRGHGVAAPEVQRHPGERLRAAGARDGRHAEDRPPSGTRRSRRTVETDDAHEARLGLRDRTGGEDEDEDGLGQPGRLEGHSDSESDSESDGGTDGEGGEATGAARGASRQGRGRSGRSGDARDRRGSRELDPEADPEEVARSIVLRKLSAQARTRVELERALKTRAVPEEAATAVLDRMSEVGLVDDAAFAHDWVASRQQRRHLSRTALRRELTTKGVDREVIDEALDTVDGSDEHSAALALAERRAAAMAGLPREVAYRRLGAMLARRGFSGSVTTQVLGEVLGDWTEG